MITASERLLMLDAMTGAVADDRAAPSDLVFAKDGTLRFEFRAQLNPVQTTIAAYSDTPGATSGELIVLNPASGAERTRLGVNGVSGRLAIHARTLFIPTTGPPPSTYTQQWRLVRLDLSTLATTILEERLGYPGHSGPREVTISSDGSVAYWLFHIQFSVGVLPLPEAPVNLQTLSADGVAELRWSSVSRPRTVVVRRGSGPSGVNELRDRCARLHTVVGGHACALGHLGRACAERSPMAGTAHLQTWSR